MEPEFLEPAARRLVEEKGSYVTASVVSTSCAISMKRQADATERLANAAERLVAMLGPAAPLIDMMVEAAAEELAELAAKKKGQADG